MNLRPMLAARTPEEADLKLLRWPLWSSWKLDGIRALVVDGVVVSRTLKPIRNAYVQRMWGKPEFNGLDGELITKDRAYRSTSSAVMTIGSEEEVDYCVFDLWNSGHAYYDRYGDLKHIDGKGGITVLPQSIIRDESMLQYEEQIALTEGAEGLILRSPHAGYKFGRSTLREQALVKLKRYEDAEAVVVGVEEKMHNMNQAKLDERGYTKRSSHKENKVGTGVLGSLTVRTPAGIEFGVGTGFDDATRTLLWAQRDTLIGRIVKYRCMPYGGYDAPRHPVFLGFRDKEDV